MTDHSNVDIDRCRASLAPRLRSANHAHVAARDLHGSGDHGGAIPLTAGNGLRTMTVPNSGAGNEIDVKCLARQEGTAGSESVDSTTVGGDDVPVGADDRLHRSRGHRVGRSSTQHVRHARLEGADVVGDMALAPRGERQFGLRVQRAPNPRRAPKHGTGHLPVNPASATPHHQEVGAQEPSTATAGCRKSRHSFHPWRRAWPPTRPGILDVSICIIR